jgi:hypothetical protein
MENKEKVAIEATESLTTFIPIESYAHCNICQCCLLCENTRKLPEGMRYCNTPWVCDECKEAIAFIKKQLKRDPLAPVLD